MVTTATTGDQCQHSGIEAKVRFRYVTLVNGKLHKDLNKMIYLDSFDKQGTRRKVATRVVLTDIVFSMTKTYDILYFVSP